MKAGLGAALAVAEVGGKGVLVFLGVVESAEEEGSRDGPASAGVENVPEGERVGTDEAGVEAGGALNIAAHDDGLDFGATGEGAGTGSEGAGVEAPVVGPGAPSGP